LRQRKLCRSVVLRKDLLCSRSVVLRSGPELRMCEGLCGSVVLLGPELLGSGCSKLRMCGSELRLRQQLWLRLRLWMRMRPLP
jgi:hypothetical protein